MDFKIRYLNGFETDLMEAIDWYKNISSKNAINLLADIEDAIHSLSRNPLLFQKVNSRVRKANLKVYPYKIVYKIIKGELVIVALAHHKRHPKYWKKRK